MFNLRNKKDRVIFIGLIISFVALIVIFCLTDGLTGDKEFSEYTSEDWSVALLPLILLGLSMLSTLVFSFMILIPMIFSYPSLVEYVTKKKFSDIDKNCEFLIFDHNEFKRACCFLESPEKLWFSVKEYDLKARNWKILEHGRYVENYTALRIELMEKYNYDEIKHYSRNNNNF